MDLRRKIAQRRALEAERETAPPAAGAPLEPAIPARPEEGGDPLYQARVARLRGMLDGLIARHKERDTIQGRADDGATLRMRLGQHGVLPGAEHPSPHGPIHIVTQTLEPDHHHGKTPVGRARSASPEIVARLALDADLAGVDLSRMLFLDTETTGLAGGTGTLPFLTGVAWFEDQSMFVEQYLVRRPSEEAAMLGKLAEKLQHASCVVSYNGKSYDLPLLRSRYVMNRMPAPVEPPHIDLLHCARRLYRRRLGEVRLVTLEERLLGFRRERDIDGHEIPSLYWSALRAGDPSALLPVLEHNANDLIALAALLGAIVERYQHLHREDDPSDHFSLAVVAQRADDRDRARRFAEAAAEGGGDERVTIDALELTARLARAEKDHHRAEVALLRALEVAGPIAGLAAPLHLELAKLYEHRLRDPARALVHARCVHLIEGEAPARKRIARLERRLQRRTLGEQGHAETTAPAERE